MEMPTKINILGVEYEIIYVDKPSEVDIYQRQSLWGQIDFWTRTIRIYENGRQVTDLWQSLMHEIIHGISQQLKIEVLNGDANEKYVDLLATGLVDTLFRNRLISGKA